MKIGWKLLFIALTMLPLPAFGQAYPDKPIKIYHGFAAGGGADLLLRTILPQLSENLGQQVIVEYRPGAGGNIAMEAVARAAPDGYTLLMGTPGLAINPSLYKNLSFDPRRDFAPISLIGFVSNVLIVNPALPANDVKQLIALAKAKPGKLNFASSGLGTSLHLAGELFKVSAGVDIVHIPYKGGAQAMTDVIGGQAEMMWNVLPSALPQIKAGTVRALAVTGKARSDTLPDVPTMQEAGLADYTAITWNGILAPAGTPKAIVTRINEAIVKALQSPDMKAKYAANGTELIWSTPEEFAAFISEETVRWSRVIQAADIKPQ
ncbi:MAG: tripartite tricarboxylate transporter substrate binding protein [Casimicrobiaceae bacterium]